MPAFVEWALAMATFGRHESSFYKRNLFTEISMTRALLAIAVTRIQSCNPEKVDLTPRRFCWRDLFLDCEDRSAAVRCAVPWPYGCPSSQG